MSHAIPMGTTPPTPGLDKEEPDLWQEDDIPRSEGDNGPGDEELDPEKGRVKTPEADTEHPKS